MSTNASPLDPADVAAHAESVRALARRLVRDGGLAEDVAQETWLAAMRRPRRDDVPLAWWLRGVVRNVVRHARRDDATRRRHELATPPGRDVDAPDALVERTEIHHRLVGAVLALEEPYRATILMRYFEDLSAAEIARRVGVPGATVRSRLKRGLDTLRARLDGDEGGDRRKWALVLAPFAWTGETRSATPWLATIAACLLLVAAATAVVVQPWNAATGDDASSDATTATAAKATSAAAANVRGGSTDRPRRARPGSTETDDVADAPAPSTAPAEPTPPADGTAVFSIEIVDEYGARVPPAGVTIEIGDFLKMCELPSDMFLAVSSLTSEPIDANPVVFKGMPKSADGKTLSFYARIPGGTPTATETFTLHAGTISKVRLVAAPPQTASVIVVDRATDLPVAGASVVSTTELSHRGVESSTVRGTASPGAAVTAGDGRCALGGLSRGEHEIEVEATGYVRAEAKWTDGELRVRMAPRPAGGTLTAIVIGKDGTPVGGIDVGLHGTHLVVKTDAAGRATFADVAAGYARVSVLGRDWLDACTARGWDVQKTPALAAGADVAAGGASEVVLGWPRAPGSVVGRVTDEDGAPIAGVKLRLITSGASDFDATTDADGEVRFVGLPAGTCFVRAVVGADANWWFDRVKLAEGERATRRWQLGAHAVRGRVVTAVDRRPLAGVDVVVVLSANVKGSARTGPDGRFELPRAVAGTYAISVREDNVGVRRTGVVVPSADELVLEVAAYGRVAVRFLAADRPQLRAAKITVVAADEPGDQSIEDGKSDDDFVAPRLVAGRYDVVVTLDGRTRRFPVDVKSGETSVVVVSAP